MAWSSALGILMKIFPDKVAKVMSWTQTCFGLGYMLGPGVGAALYEQGGFMLPFFGGGKYQHYSFNFFGIHNSESIKRFSGS